MTKKYTCYHFSNAQGTLGFGDNRQIVLGETLSVDGTPKMCEWGLHGSQSILDALGYASGCHLWKVEISGNVDLGDDKLCGNNRKAIADYGDVMFLVVEFAKWCADRAAKSAKYATKSAKSAEYAAEYAEYAAESAEYAKSAAKSAAEYAAEYAKYAAESAAKSAEYAAEYAKSNTSERQLQEQWWQDKLQQLKG